MELRFRVPAEEEMERPPTQRDQFDNDDVELVDALVRESIQNSLDAKLKGHQGPVHVAFRIEEIDGPRLASANGFLHPEELNTHLRACELIPIDPDAPMRVLVVEDFGTSGLTGSFNQWDEMPFCDFWRRMGRSHKGGQALGRWGLGKLVFSSVSRARVFFGLTQRPHETEQLLMGQAVLTTHHLEDGTRQDSHGFYAASGTGIQLPESDVTTIRNFCITFGVKRSAEAGLSVVAPYLRDNISPDRIIKGILRNYFFPILFGRLVVTVGDVVIDAVTFASLTAKLDPGHFANGDLASFIQVMKESRDPSSPVPVVLAVGWAKPQTLDASLGETVESLRARLNDGGVIVVRAPFLLKRKDGNEFRTFIDLFLQRAQADAPALFVRGSIVLNAESRYFRGRKVFSAVIADDPTISEFLGDAENPAHTGWSASAEKVSARWRAPRERLAEVRGALQKLYNSLLSAVETFDKDALIDIFSIPSDDGSKERRNKGENVDPVKIPDIPIRRKTFRVIELSDGFSIKSSLIDESQLPFSIRVRVAYDVLRGNPFSKHDPADFDLRSNSNKQLKFSGRGATLSAIDPAIFQIDVVEKEFFIDVRGFDTNRDLIVDAEKVS